MLAWILRSSVGWTIGALLHNNVCSVQCAPSSGGYVMPPPPGSGPPSSGGYVMPPPNSGYGAPPAPPRQYGMPPPPR